MQNKNYCVNINGPRGNIMKYKIVADSCCDITESNKTYGKVDLIPLTLMLEGKEYIDDKTFNQKEFIKKYGKSNGMIMEIYGYNNMKRKCKKKD